MIHHLRRWPRLCVFVIALGWMFGLEERYRNDAIEHQYFQSWTSEYMMQVVNLVDLRIEPFKSLWYNHIQPPVFDSIRAALVAIHPNANDGALIRRVDADLYEVWLFVYATAAVLVFSFLRRAISERSAVLGTVVFLLLPGPIFYASFLDSTMLSSTLILWFFWALWRLGRGDNVVVELVVVSLVLFFTRSVIQWPFLPVLAFSLWAMRIPRARAVRIMVPVSIVMLAFLTKQYVLFGLTTTSSFGPDSFCKGLSEYCHGTTKVALPKTVDRYKALVLRRAEKLNGDYNYNQEAFLLRSFSQMEEYKGLLRRMTLGHAIELLQINVNFYLRPTSRHSPHVIVDQLPWREAMDVVLSGWRFVLLVVISSAIWIRRAWALGGQERLRALIHCAGLALPAVYVAAVTIVFESGENMRYRFFLEPTMVVFFWISLASLLPARKPEEPRA